LRPVLAGGTVVMLEIDGIDNMAYITYNGIKGAELNVSSSIF
jgi:hypothetical protein